MSEKQADLLDSVVLQPHQQQLAEEAEERPLRKILYHGLGSGKTLSSIAAAEAQGAPYTAVVPAALRNNYRGEQAKFTNQSLPSDVLSYTELARGKMPSKLRSLIFDEAHRLRNPGGSAAQRAQQLADKADQVLLLTGTPATNRPGDIAPLMSMVTEKKLTPEEFESRYVKEQDVNPSFLQRLLYGITPGREQVPNNTEELKALLKGHVDYYEPEKPEVPVNREDHVVEMSPDQTRLYNAMWKKLPFITRWKLERDFPLSNDELLRLKNFLAGPRQVSLSTMPYLHNKDPEMAFSHSPKLQKAYDLLQETLKDKRSKALVFSNFIDAGLVPYADALKRNNIPHAVFSGKLSDAERKKLVDDYNSNRIRVALLGPSGTEGLSFKGTQLVQLLDPHYHGVRPRQAEGRALRFGSHRDLPPELQNVKVQRFISRLPPKFLSRLKTYLWSAEPDYEKATDDHLMNISEKKDKLNEEFLNILREVGSEGKV